jgi:hypothetical protein
MIAMLIISIIVGIGAIIIIINKSNKDINQMIDSHIKYCKSREKFILKMRDMDHG